jgi:hypothetical protein
MFRKLLAYVGRHHIGLVALAVALGGSAYAAIPARNGTIKACYTTRGGALRVVDESTRRCPRGQRLLAWNQRGLRGLRGLQGIQGQQGLQGAQGGQGIQGDIGPTGPGAAFATASVADVLTLQGNGDFFISAGPNVTVTVPASGLIEVWAEAELRQVSGSASYPPMVGLREDGVDSLPLPFCQFDIKGILTVPPAVTSFTHAFTGGPQCGRTVNPAPLILRTSPGAHTYSMVYVNRPTVVAEFRNRFLAVAPRP